MDKDLLEIGAVLQRDRSTYAISPQIPAGIAEPNMLRKIADVAQKYHAEAIKITNGQRIAIIGIKEEDVKSAWKDLNIEGSLSDGVCTRHVKACPGNQFCKRGEQDAIGLSKKLGHVYRDKNFPNKLKIAVSGCPNSCADNHFRDIGICGTSKGYIIEVGGKGGEEPRIADIICRDIEEPDVIPIIDRIVSIYEEYGQKNERIGNYIDRVGLEEFKDQLKILH